MPSAYYLRWWEKPRDTVVTVVQQTTPATVIAGSALIETKVGEDREFTLRGGSRAVLRGGSRFWYKYLGLIPGSVATLQGELAVEVTQSDRPLVVQTAVGHVFLYKPGSYVVRCSASCGAMLVGVGAAGLAFMTGTDTAKGRLTLLKNEKGAVKEGGVPQKVTGENLYDWPKLLSPLATAKP
jgi:hypothetical protein